MKRVILRLDEASARELYDLLYALGEHQAAGAPIPLLDTEASERIAAILRETESQLGIPNLERVSDTGSRTCRKAVSVPIPPDVAEKARELDGTWLDAVRRILFFQYAMGEKYGMFTMRYSPDSPAATITQITWDSDTPEQEVWSAIERTLGTQLPRHQA